MQSIAARFLSSFTLCSVAAIAALDCSNYVPTFGLISKLSMLINVGYLKIDLINNKDKNNILLSVL